MRVTEHVRKIQAQASDLALAIQALTSQSIAATRRQVVTHQQPRHRLALTFLSGSNSLSIKTLKPAPQDAGFFMPIKKARQHMTGFSIFSFLILFRLKEFNLDLYIDLLADNIVKADAKVITAYRCLR